MPTEQRVGTPHGDGRLVTYRARRPVATLLLSHGAGRGIDTRDLEALAATLPAPGHQRAAVRAAVAGGRRQGRQPAGHPRRRLHRRRQRAAHPHAARGRRPLGRGPVGGADRHGPRRGRLPGAGLPAAPARAAGEVAARRAARRRRDHARRAGRERHLRAARRVPRPTLDLAVVPSADHGFATPKRSGVTEEDAMAVVVESTLEWIVREVAGNRLTGIPDASDVPCHVLAVLDRPASPVDWEAMTDTPEDDPRGRDRRPRRPSPRPTAPLVSSATRCRSSTSSTPRPCG